MGIETFQNLKRLQFHKDKTRKSGKSEESVYINGNEIERTPHHMYLWKIIEEKGKHEEDIKERMIKGNAAAIISTSIINKKNLTNKRIEVGLKLLQSVIIPTIVSGA